jgi:hypothetical protein
MTIKNFNQFIKESLEYNYMMLDRLRQDCDYFLGHGNVRRLWAGSVKEQIAKMKELWNTLPEKPEWLTYEQIEEYERKMLNDSSDERFNDVIIPDELKDEYTKKFG